MSALFLCEDTASFPLWGHSKLSSVRTQQAFLCELSSGPNGPSLGVNMTDTWILDFQPPQLIGSIHTFQIAVLELISSKWQHRSFLTSLSLTRRPTSNYPQTRHYCETPRTPGMRLKHLYGLQRSRRSY